MAANMAVSLMYKAYKCVFGGFTVCYIKKNGNDATHCYMQYFYK